MNALLIAMTQGRSKRIGRVRRRHAVELQDGDDHVLHLFLRCRTRTHDGLFDLARRIFEDLDVMLEGRAQRRRARMPEFQRAAGILVHENAFDRHDIRSVFAHNAPDRIENLAQPVRETTVQAFNRAARPIGSRVTVKLKDTKTGQA